MSNHACRSFLVRLGGIAGVCAGLIHVVPARAALPLTENTWDNPAFVAKFVGSYGFDTERTPSITSEEKKLFEQIAPLMQSDAPQAIQLLTAAIKPESSAALNYTLANLHFQRGESEAAIKAYQAALAKFPNFARAHKNLAMLLVQEGRYDDALTHLHESARVGGLDGSLTGLLGFCYLNKGRVASALDAYRLALFFEPDSRDWRLGKAQCLLQIGENKEAIALLDEMIGEQANQADLLLLQANALIADGQPMKAAANLQIVHSLGKSKPDSLALLGDIYVNNGSTEMALPFYLEAVEGGTLGSARMLRMIRVLAARDAWDDADAIIGKIKSTPGAKLDDKSSLELMNLEAQVALGKNDDARAAKILESVVAKEPLNGRAMLLLADFHARKSEIEKAELYYDRAASVAEVAPDALVQHARLLVTKREFARAAELLTKAQNIKPQAHVAAYLAKVETAAQAVR